ncbi:MAG: tellurium resistance protein, partial [Okeania sp. SIO2D1]|nr:tellurium resistance protein [Okeania sp. SIO2D1]
MCALPEGAISNRPLHFIWICDKSGSMSVDGKIDSLNKAINLALPSMRQVADANPNAKVRSSTLA